AHGDSGDRALPDAMNRPLATRSIDGAFVVTGLGEVPDPEVAVAELKRVLKPAGTLGFSESVGDPDFVFAGTLRRVCGGAGLVEARHWRGPPGATKTVWEPPPRPPPNGGPV